MSTPDKEVVYALIESYLNMRKDKWSLVNANDEIALPNDESEAAQKIDVCVRILQQAKDCYFIDEWISLIKLLYNMEQNELERHNNYWLPRRKFGSVLLIETLQAIRSYILQQMNTDRTIFRNDDVGIGPIFSKYKEALTTHTNYVAHPDLYSPDQVEKAKNALDAADRQYKPYNLDELERNKRDHLSFFSNRIMVNDPRSKELKELSFSDFEKNVKLPDEKLKRKSHICLKLLNHKLTHKQPTFAPASTGGVSNESIDVDVAKTADKTKEVKFAAPTVTAAAPAPTTSSSSISKTKSHEPTAESRKSTKNKHHDSKSSALRDNSTFKSSSNDNSSDAWLSKLLEPNSTHHYNTRSHKR